MQCRSWTHRTDMYEWVGNYTIQVAQTIEYSKHIYLKIYKTDD